MRPASPIEDSALNRAKGVRAGAGLEVRLAGLRLVSPAVLTSGVLGNSAALLTRAARSGAGAVTTKTLTRRPREGNPNPVVVRLDVGLLNSMGLPNPGIEPFMGEIRRYKSLNLGSPLIVSIWSEDPSEAAEMASMAQEAGADALEVNVSCPNVPSRRISSEFAEGAVRELVGSVSGATRLPVFVKLPPLHWGLPRLAVAAVEAGAEVLVATNTLRGMTIDVYARRPILSSGIGGLSGPALKPVALRAVYELYEEFGGSVQIVGVGGVGGWRDAVEYLLAGASCVGIGTAILSRGLGVFRDVAAGIERYVREEGLSSISDLVGAAHRR